MDGLPLSVGKQYKVVYNLPLGQYSFLATVKEIKKGRWETISQSLPQKYRTHRQGTRTHIVWAEFSNFSSILGKLLWKETTSCGPRWQQCFHRGKANLDFHWPSSSRGGRPCSSWTWGCCWGWWPASSWGSHCLSSSYSLTTCRRMLPWEEFWKLWHLKVLKLSTNVIL